MPKQSYIGPDAPIDALEYEIARIKNRGLDHRFVMECGSDVMYYTDERGVRHRIVTPRELKDFHHDTIVTTVAKLSSEFSKAMEELKAVHNAAMEAHRVEVAVLQDQIDELNETLREVLDE